MVQSRRKQQETVEVAVGKKVLVEKERHGGGEAEGSSRKIYK